MGAWGLETRTQRNTTPAQSARRRNRGRAAEAASAHAQINKTVVRATATPGGDPVSAGTLFDGARATTGAVQSASPPKNAISNGTKLGASTEAWARRRSTSSRSC